MNVYQRKIIEEYLKESELEPKLDKPINEREDLIQEGYNNAVLEQRQKIKELIEKLNKGPFYKFSK